MERQNRVEEQAAVPLLAGLGLGATAGLYCGKQYPGLTAAVLVCATLGGMLEARYSDQFSKTIMRTGYWPVLVVIGWKTWDIYDQLATDSDRSVYMLGMAMFAAGVTGSIMGALTTTLFPTRKVTYLE